MKRRKYNLKLLIFTAMLSAIGIIIPTAFGFMRIGVPPASFTPMSHVPLFIAMFLSPMSAIIVGLATALGFFITTLPVIGVRALSHVVWAVPAAFLIKKFPSLINSIPKSILFNVVIAVVHSVLEVIVVLVFLFMGWNIGGEIAGNIFVFFFLIMGLGGIAHSIFDFAIAQIIFKRIDFGQLFDKPQDNTSKDAT